MPESVNKRKHLQSAIGYAFRDEALLVTALTHSSYANEKHMGKNACNERLEFLGDAVLELVISNALYAGDPSLPEGDLTRRRASLVCEPALSHCASVLDLGSCLLLGKGVEKEGGRQRSSITSDALEALIGAIYLDGGYEAARSFIHEHVLAVQKEHVYFSDSKTLLQELMQAGGGQAPSYRIVSEEGPDHDRLFTAEVLAGDTVLASGTGRTKKAAAQNAAKEAIQRLKEQPHVSEKD